MKYRCLSNEELKELEEEFKHFLISNNVYTDEWEKFNKNKDKKVTKLVEMFSDIVINRALKNIRFLEHVTPTDIKVFHCANNKIILIGIVSDNPEIDFTTQTIEKLKTISLNIFKTEKLYTKERESEVFDLLQSGCYIINEERFKKLELAHTYSTKQSQN